MRACWNAHDNASEREQSHLPHASDAAITMAAAIIRFNCQLSSDAASSEMQHTNYRVSRRARAVNPRNGRFFARRECENLRPRETFIIYSRDFIGSLDLRSAFVPECSRLSSSGLMINADNFWQFRHDPRAHGTCLDHYSCDSSSLLISLCLSLHPAYLPSSSVYAQRRQQLFLSLQAMISCT